MEPRQLTGVSMGANGWTIERYRLGWRWSAYGPGGSEQGVIEQDDEAKAASLALAAHDRLMTTPVGRED